MRKAYTLIFSLLLLLGLPLLPLLLLWPKARKGLPQRFGVLPREARRMALVGRGSLWVHAASLGEVNAVAPVLTLLLERIPETPLVFTCTTHAGLDQARRLFPQAVAHLLMPLDLPFFLAPYFRRFKPIHALIAETELWPNFLRGLRERGAQVVLANARMSEKSLSRYAPFAALFGQALLDIDAIAAQSEEDARRYLALGAKESRVLVTGNTKFDAGAKAAEARRKGEALRAELGLAQGQELVVAASTRPGDEELFLWAFSQFAQKRKGIKLLIAPRHLERLDEVLSAVARAGARPSLRSHGPAGSEVLVLDTLGELPAALSLASLAWIGGSYSRFGGQSPIEAASLGVPAIFGPDMRHFRDPARILKGAGAALEASAQQLPEESLKLLSDPARRAAMAEAGLKAVKAASGASARCAGLMWKLVVTRRLREDEHDWRERSAFSAQKVLEFGSLASQIKNPPMAGPLPDQENPTLLVRDREP